MEANHSSAMKLHSHIRHIVHLLCVILCIQHSHADAVRVWTEYAPDLNGPWTVLDPTTQSVDANGHLVLPTDGGNLFFRTRIAGAGNLLRQEVPVSVLPAEILEHADNVLRAGRSRPGDPEAWPEDAVLHPIAIPVFDGAQEQRDTASFIEFKVVRSSTAPPSTAPLLKFAEDVPQPTPLGFILVSLTETEVPVPQYATRGETISEQLARLARTPNFRLVRFGGDFWAAEDAAGNLLANQGAHPWKPDPAMVTQLTQDLVWEGDDDTRTEIEPTLPAFQVQFYDSYAAFKTDFRVNPVYVALRQQRAVRASAEWDLARGVLPGVVQLSPGQSLLLLPGVSVTRHYLDTEDEARVADATPAPEGGGLTVTAIAPGEGMLEVLAGTSIHRFAIQVVNPSPPPAAPPPGDAFVPGWYRVYEKFVGDYTTQARYAQMKDSEWQGYIGCGPNGWAALLAWWERERGVYLAFGSNFYNDAPAEYYDGAPKNRLRPVLKQLRDISGGVYNPFDDSFATPPDSMPKSILTVTYFNSMLGWMTRSWKMRWSAFAQTLNGDGGAREVRDAIKSNYCAVVGLGNYWHYAVAYGYTVDNYYNTENGPSLGTRRWLRCNMCWGPKSSNAHWRDYYDTFFSTRLRLKLTAACPPELPVPNWW